MGLFGGGARGGARGATADAARRGGGFVPKSACGSFGLARMSPPRSGGGGFVTRGDSGSWVDIWQTRCLSGTKPQLPGTSKPFWGLLTGTERHSQPPGMVRSGFSLYFLIFLYISLNSALKPPCCTRGQCPDVPLGDTASKPTLISMCPGLGHKRGGWVCVLSQTLGFTFILLTINPSREGVGAPSLLLCGFGIIASRCSCLPLAAGPEGFRQC